MSKCNVLVLYYNLCLSVMSLSFTIIYVKCNVLVLYYNLCLSVMLDSLCLFTSVCFLTNCQGRPWEVWGPIVLCKTCSVLLCVLEQPRVDNSITVPLKSGVQLA